MKTVIMLIAVLALTSVAQGQEATPPSSLQDKITCSNIVKKSEKGFLPYSAHDSEGEVSTTSHWDAKTQICYEIQTQTIHGTKTCLDCDGATYDGYNIFIVDAVEGTRYAAFISSWKHTATSPTERHLGWGSIDNGGDHWSSTGRKDFYLLEFSDRVFKALGIKL